MLFEKLKQKNHKELYIRFLFCVKQMIKYNIKDILPFEISLTLFNQIYAENI